MCVALEYRAWFSHLQGINYLRAAVSLRSIPHPTAKPRSSRWYVTPQIIPGIHQAIQMFVCMSVCLCIYVFVFYTYTSMLLYILCMYYVSMYMLLSMYPSMYVPFVGYKTNIRIMDTNCKRLDPEPTLLRFDPTHTRPRPFGPASTKNKTLAKTTAGGSRHTGVQIVTKRWFHWGLLQFKRKVRIFVSLRFEVPWLLWAQGFKSQQT